MVLITLEIIVVYLGINYNHIEKLQKQVPSLEFYYTFLGRVYCILEQYQKQPSVFNQNITLNANKTQNEDITDNAGIKGYIVLRQIQI